MSASFPFSIAFQLTFEEWDEAISAERSTQSVAKRVVLATYSGLVGLGFLFCVWFLRDRLAADKTLWFPALFFIGIGLFGVWGATGQLGLRAYKRASLPNQEETRIVFDTAGLLYSKGRKAYSIDWSRVGWIMETGDTLIFKVRAVALIIPKRALSDDQKTAIFNHWRSLGKIERQARRYASHSY